MATIPTALRPRLSRRALATLLVAALGVPLVAGAGWIAFSNDDLLGDMELAATKGVTIIRGSETIAVDGTVDLQPLDLIQTSQGSSGVTFNLEGRRSIELAPASQARILSTTSVEAVGGNLLARAGADIKVRAGDEVTVSGRDSVFRVDKTSTARIGTYSGSVEVAAPGEEALKVTKFWQATVSLAAPDLPSSPSPYALNRADAWDRAEFEEIVRLDHELSQVANGLAAQFRGARPNLAYYQDVAGSKVGFMRGYLRHRPSDLLVGLTVAEKAKGPLPDSFGAAFELFDRGARWSIAATILGVTDPDVIVRRLSALVQRSGVSGGGAADPFVGSDAPGGVPGSPNGPNEGPGQGGPPPGTDPGPDPDPDPDPDPTPTTKPKPTNPPPECSNDVECTIEDLEPPVDAPDNPLDEEIEEGLDLGDTVKSAKDSLDSDLL